MTSRRDRTSLKEPRSYTVRRAGEKDDERKKKASLSGDNAEKMDVKRCRSEDEKQEEKREERKERGCNVAIHAIPGNRAMASKHQVLVSAQFCPPSVIWETATLLSAQCT